MRASHHRRQRREAMRAIKATKPAHDVNVKKTLEPSPMPPPCSPTPPRSRIAVPLASIGGRNRGAMLQFVALQMADGGHKRGFLEPRTVRKLRKVDNTELGARRVGAASCPIVPTLDVGVFTNRKDLGYGGYSRVEIASWGCRRVVLKIFKGDDRIARGNLLKELEMCVMGRASPYVVIPIGKTTTVEGTPCLAFPYRGPTLGEAISEGTMTEPLDWCFRLCEAFGSLHRDAQVLHLDVKGNNVLVDVVRRRVYIIDLGLSVPVGRGVIGAQNPYYGKETKLRYWQPPELATVKEAKSSMEVYSIAFLLADILVPKERGHHTEKLVLGPIGSKYGKEVEDTVLRCFSSDPESRPTLDELSTLFLN